MKKSTKKNNIEQQKSATVVLRHLRIAPRKVRLVADLVRNMPVNEAEAQLLASNKKGAHPLYKLLRSGIASATQKELRMDALTVATIQVDEGATLKRWMPRAMGRATPLHKRTSHVTLTLQESKKDVQSRFVTVTLKKEKKGKEESDKKGHVHKEGETHDHSHETPATVSEQKPEEKKTAARPKKETAVDPNATKEKSKKLFRRKSV
jgi:large subunit ribosomal protein L22